MSKSVAKNASAKMLLNILNIVLPIITGPYLARILDVNLYGEFNKANSIIIGLIPFASFGIYNFGLRSISKLKNDYKKLSKVFSILFTFSIISATFVFLIYNISIILNNSVLNKSIYLILSFQLLAQIFYVEWVNEALENYGFILFKTIIIKLINVCLILILIKHPTDIFKYCSIYTGLLVLNYLISFIYVKKKIQFQQVVLKDLLKICPILFIMVILSNSNMLFTFLDKMFLSAFSSENKYISYYAFAQTITMMITQVINAIILVTLPRLSFYISQKDYKNYYILLNLSSKTFFMLGIPMCIGIACLSRPIMFMYGGIKYIEADLTLLAFSVRTILWLFDVSLANQVIFIHEREKSLSKIYFFCGGINLLLNLLLLKFNLILPQNLILTTMISEIILIICETVYIRKTISKNFITVDLKIIKYLVVSLMFFPLSKLLFKILNFKYVFDILFVSKTTAIVAVCFVYYFSLLLILKDKVLINLMQIVLSKMKSLYNRFKL